MKVKILENQSLNDVHITIECPIYNQDIKNIIHLLKQEKKTILCQKDKSFYQIAILDIYYIESLDDKTFVYLKDDIYQTSLRLYELEELLKEHHIIRISKSCLLNIKYLKSVRVFIYGKYEATLMNQEKLIISRKYMPAFKKEFGI